MININERIVDKISTISVANDKEVIKLEFKCKNQVTDLIKLSDCNVFINYQNGTLKDRYAVTDLAVSGEEVTFSWTLGRNATAKQGKTYFIVCAVIMDGADVKQEWNSVLTSFDVQKGLEAVPAQTEEYQDIIAQLTEMINEKLSPRNIKAGQNVTVEVDGNDVIINSTGGGTADAYTKAETDALLDQKQNKGDYATASELSAEETARQNADINLQGQIDAITVSSDVIDVVGTYADLQNYDTQHVKANDIIKVLQDSTHNDALSYYRWVITENIGAWVYVGSEGPFYTKAESDTRFQEKLNVDYGLSLNGTTLSLNGKEYKFVNTLPQSGVTDTVYFTPNGLPADVANAVNAAYEHWGSLSGYPYLMFVKTKATNKYWLFLTNNTAPYVNGDLYTSGSCNILEVTWNSATQTATNFRNIDYLNHIFEEVEYVNYDLAGNQAHTTTYKEANISSDIDYSNGASIANSFTGYIWNGSAFEIKDKIDVAIIINAIMGVVNSGLVKKQNVLVSGTNIKTINSTSLLGSGDIEIPIPLEFSNLSVATTDWIADSTYADYGYKAVLTCQGVTASMDANVYLSSASAALGVVASFCDEGTDSVTIYSTTNENAITIDKVVAS